MKLSWLVTLLALGGSMAWGQDAPRWTSTQKLDPLRSVIEKDFTLQGKYLTAPQKPQSGNIPAIELRCSYDPQAKGRHAHPEMLEALINIGAVADGTPDKHGDALAHIHFRLNDGKLQEDWWQLTADQAHLRFVGFGSQDSVTHSLLGHVIPHHRRGDLDLGKIIIGVNEFQGREVVMEFDLPESDDLAESCGTVWR